ncbi:hypothetical protein E3P92_02745 [Wallemia ichthyophaga]|uniref:Histone chaperone domain-containing protein n=1 Tax=Wallemia ichthyophaga TaxID=245174 RepID=A0A4T0JJN6_WALIC|nr:hypothetical protein E3P91_02697 [Wallemia ichthyophaga]TIA98333.1 hypothetical protein E3P95_02498 [Wallemia ichthyophaga]TIA99454.1 hypothetical protein E3P94_02520 [Wallemia ichthyophaga]TIB11063.1 hypothetical protein E3P90_02569 [Wallemia ichthyophaga]TIB11758.1 hypothetical protein E3P93_02466 [Wallemia ichthyophaga]
MTGIEEKKNDQSPQGVTEKKPEVAAEADKGKAREEEEDEEDEEDDDDQDTPYNDEEVGDDVVDDDLEEIDPSAIVDSGSRRTRSNVDYSSADARKKAELTDKEDEDDEFYHLPFEIFSIFNGYVNNTNICLPEKMSLCCAGGIPSFSSTLSLILKTLSSTSTSSEISFPVNVFTLISMCCANGIDSKQLFKQMSGDSPSISHLKHKILNNLQHSNAITKRHSLRLEPPTSHSSNKSSKSNLVTLPDGHKAIAHSQWLWYSSDTSPPQFSQSSAQHRNILPPHNSMRLEKKGAHAERVLLNRQNREAPKITPPKPLLDGFSVPRQLHSSLRDSLSRQRQHDKVVNNLKFWHKSAAKVGAAEDAFNRGKQSAR